MELKGKVVLISGATGGMGEALTALLSKEGCKLTLFARREENLQTIAQKYTQFPSQIIYQQCNVKKKEEIKHAVAYTMKHFGRIDIAILTAGILVPNPIETFDSTIITESLDINFTGTVYFIEQLLPVMKKQHEGIIAAVSTLPDKRGIPGWGAYGSSKAALTWLLESLRAEAKQKYNIDIITIKPGSVKTPMIAHYHRPGAITPEKAAEIIINGIKRKKKIIQFPFSQVLMTRLGDLFPTFAYDMIPVDMQKGDGYPEVEEETLD